MLLALKKKDCQNMTRKEEILKLIVQHFIRTAEPVASKTLIDQYGLDFSSATIRAEMNELEKEGLLEKTHTSSGRIPSKKGYEYYLAHLRENNINDEIKMRLQTVMDKKVASVENVIKESCEILAKMTNLVSVISSNDSHDEHLVNIQIVPISSNSATAILVTDKGYVENRTFVFEDKVSVDDITSCVKLLNDRLKGTSISELVPKMEAIKPILSDYVIDHDVIYQALLETFLRFASDRLEIFNKDELLNQPEFKNDAARLKKVIELFDNPNRLKQEIMKVGKNVNDNVSVHIADKDKSNDMSVVSASISLGKDNEGTISLLGPTRMDYDKAVSLLDYVAKTLNEHFKMIGGNNDERRKAQQERNEKGSEAKRKSPKRSQ
ncbi:MAG: heat-inducible transcriptional repressor HrcA [Bacilli bacterium]|nr:heat-inducible transcriptional repressor HrcA [Bacilli bacterium]